MQQDPNAIFEANLRGVTRGVWTRDLACLLGHIGLPHRVITQDSEVVLTSAADLDAAMNALRDQFEEMGATEYRQIGKGAAFVPGRRDTIVATHETRLLKNETLLAEPYLSRMTMIQMDGTWKSVFIETETPNHVCKLVADHMARRHEEEMLRLARSVR